MSTRGIEIRLRKLESRQRDPGMIYFAWGRTYGELDSILAAAFSNGELGPQDPNVCVLCEEGSVPVSGWRVYQKLTEEEDKALFARIERVAGSEPHSSKRSTILDQMTDEQLLTKALGRPIPRLLTH